VDYGKGSNGIQITGLRGVYAGFALRHYDDRLILA
jgi:hypothetical protein